MKSITIRKIVRPDRCSFLYNSRYPILDVILRAIEALSVIDGHSQEICLNKELFQLVSDLLKFPDKVEVHFSSLGNMNYEYTNNCYINEIVGDVVSFSASRLSGKW